MCRYEPLCKDHQELSKNALLGVLFSWAHVAVLHFSARAYRVYLCFRGLFIARVRSAVQQ